jgi:hypothetical protein
MMSNIDVLLLSKNINLQTFFLCHILSLIYSFFCITTRMTYLFQMKFVRHFDRDYNDACYIMYILFFIQKYE